MTRPRTAAELARGEAIKAARDAVGLSQKRFADAVGASERTAKRWEKGADVSAAFRPRIEEVVGVAYADLDRGYKPKVTLDSLSARLDAIEADQKRMITALGLDADTPPNVAQALATVAGLEQRILRLLAALGAPEASQWLSDGQADQREAGGAS